MTSRIVGITAIVALSAAGTAMAGPINGTFNSGSNSGLRTNVAVQAVAQATTFNVGALTHAWAGGTGETAIYNGSHASFCIDNQYASTSLRIFNLVRITQAPIAASGNWGNPGVSYTTTQERRLNAIVLAARNAGYVNNLGFFNVSQGQDASVAIQLLSWESLWEPDSQSGNWNVATNQGTFYRTSAISANAATIIGNLVNAATTIFNDVNTPILVRSLSSNGGQDQFVLVPLPPAAWAGLSTLAGVGFVGYIRRRKNAAQ